MHELIRITKKWLDPSKTSAAAIVETVVVDRYLRALPYEAKKVVSQSTPVTAGALVEAIEQYQATNEMLRMGKKEQPMSQGRHVNPYPKPHKTSQCIWLHYFILIFFFLAVHLCVCLLRMSTHLYLFVVNPVEDLLLYPHVGWLWLFFRTNSGESPEPYTQAFAFSHTAPQKTVMEIIRSSVHVWQQLQW